MLKTKKQLLDVIRTLTNGMIAGKPIPSPKHVKGTPDKGFSHFSDVFIVSALNGDGVTDIKVYNNNNHLISIH